MHASKNNSKGCGLLLSLPNLVTGILLTGLAAATLYMTVRSSSHMSEIAWLPRWIGEWADRNPDARTAVPFFLLALIYPGTVTRLSAGTSKRAILDWLAANCEWLIAGYFGISLFMVGSEFCQFFIDTRDLRLADIWWGLGGLALGAVCGLCAWIQLGRLISRLIPPEAVTCRVPEA